MLIQSVKKTQWVGWYVNSTEWGSNKKWLPEAFNADFSWLREHTCPRTLWLQAWMRSQGWRACIAPRRVGLHQADGAQQGKRGGHGCSGVAAWPGDAARWCWRQGHRPVQGACARVLPPHRERCYQRSRSARQGAPCPTKRASKVTCLHCRHEQLALPQEHAVSLRQGSCFPGSTLQESYGSHCRRGHLLLRGSPLVYERAPHIQ